MTTPGAPLLETRGLRKHFGGGRTFLARSPLIRAVDGVDLAIREGETFAIVGESGCGKSTLGRLLVRLLDPTEGAVIYRGRDLAAVPSEEMRRLRRELQFVFQDPYAALNPRMTVGGIVGEPLWLDGVPAREREARVAELLRTVGLLPGHADRYPHEFSGGQRQRIGIARALAGTPKLVIGDEPVSALDVSIQAQIINLLEELKESFGLTLVVVAHDLAVIRHMSDRVAVMYLGEIVECAATDDLFDAPRHPYTQALMAAIPVPRPGARGPRELLQGDVPSPAAPPPGCRFHTRCPHARDLCRTDRPTLETTEGGRQVACHFWREIAGAGASPLVAPTPSPAFARRLALYRRGRAAAPVRNPS
ncbi:ABC transporter ATP-binding protein [Prosthecomicrobium sp. N25]|uniref:ABC transporter ATP-binding protein n=1 Tax=Prosthecomicrobium sp. N25 TaxID=3129254 RepID=UPI003076A7FB